MTKYKVVLVPFPFDDLSSSKLRPAVCLTNPIGPHRHVVIAFISSQTTRDTLESDLLIAEQEPDFPMIGLKQTSTLKLHRLTTISTSIISRELGELSPDRIKKVIRKLKNLFEI